MHKDFISGFSDDLEKMIDYQVSLGYSKSTYMYQALGFDKFCFDNYPNLNVVTEPLVWSWIRCDDSKDTRIIHGRLAFIRLLSNYQKATGKNPFYISHKFTVGRTTFIPYIFNDDELAELFNEIDRYSINHTKLPLMYSAYFRLTYTCGLRPKEGRELMRDDINDETGEIRIVKSKYHINRKIVVSDDMLRLLRTYLISRDLLYHNNTYLFPNRGGKPYSSEHMNDVFKKCFEASKSDVPKGLLPSVRVYDLRHRFATTVLNTWLDQNENISSKLSYLQNYMGHKSLASTLYYIHLLPERLVKSPGINWEKMNCMIPEVDLWEE